MLKRNLFTTILVGLVLLLSNNAFGQKHPRHVANGRFAQNADVHKRGVGPESGRSAAKKAALGSLEGERQAPDSTSLVFVSDQKEVKRPGLVMVPDWKGIKRTEIRTPRRYAQYNPKELTVDKGVNRKRVIESVSTKYTMRKRH